MKHVIIGSAGHVDHGKTSLIKAITGIDGDRLKEEKKRGITIELGFAHIDFDNDIQAGIVDVPGHEAFIKNMLMGAGGIDIAMLIVAADEGFMPQTIEHLQILTLLGIKKGIVVITKTDLADPEFVEMVKEDVIEHTQGTFLEGCPIVAVSAYTGENISLLKENLRKLIDETEDKNTHSQFRLPVDRVFSVEGFGTVVTGTLTDGRACVGDEIMIYPQKIGTKIRNLQVHGKNVDTAYAGQRVAVNLASVKKTDLNKGSVIAATDSVKCSMMVDVTLSVLKDSKRIVKNGSMLHFHHGSANTLCKVCLLDRDVLNAGEECFAQLRLTEEMATREKDRFVVRFYSPLETIGGGVILNSNPKRHKRNDKKVIEELDAYLNANDSLRVLASVKKNSKELKGIKSILDDVSLVPEAVQNELNNLLNDGKIIEYIPKFFIDLETLGEFSVKLTDILKKYHNDNPLSQGMKQSELKQKLMGKVDSLACDGIFKIFENDNLIKRNNELVSLYDFEVKYSQKHKEILNKIIKELINGGFAPISVDDIYKLFPKDKDDCKKVFTALINDEKIVMVTPQIVFAKEVYEKAYSLLISHFEENSEIILSQARDMFKTSRKFALALLEYWDKIKVTKMQGEARILLKK